MLGLGNSLVTDEGVSGTGIAPNSITGLDAWFQFNTGVVGADGGASEDGDMANGVSVLSFSINLDISPSTISGAILTVKYPNPIILFFYFF